MSYDDLEVGIASRLCRIGIQTYIPLHRVGESQSQVLILIRFKTILQRRLLVINAILIFVQLNFFGGMGINRVF